MRCQRKTFGVTLKEILKKLESGSVQFSSVTQLCPTLCDPMDWSMPGLPVHHQLLEFTQTHVHRVGDHLIYLCGLLLTHRENYSLSSNYSLVQFLVTFYFIFS